jgi:hypothetical protein
MPSVKTVVVDERKGDKNPIKGNKPHVPKAGPKEEKVKNVKPIAIEDPVLNKILYECLMVNGVTIPDSTFRITAAKAKKWLLWQSKKEWIAMQMENDKTLKPEIVEELWNQKCKEKVLLEDEYGEPIICFANLNNRPLIRKGDRSAESYAQDILSKNWAGPSVMEGETVNGETIIIGRNGRVMSGQHRLIGLILAVQKWEREVADGHWHQIWAEEPYLESLYVLGVSESQKILETLDENISRTEADSYTTSDIFADLSKSERKEISRKMAAAVDFLWFRTRVGEGNSYEKYQTHSAAKAFNARHPKLEECVRHIFEEDKKRAISTIVSAGKVAAMLYMMGSSASDGDEYYKPDSPSEESLNWDNFDRAKEFFSELIKKESTVGEVLRAAISKLKTIDEAAAKELGVEQQQTMGGRFSEVCAILAKGWAVFLEGKEELTEEHLKLNYTTNEDGNPILDDRPDFGGIDKGPESIKVDPPAPSEEDIAQKAKDDRVARMEAAKARLAEDAAKKEGQGDHSPTGKPLISGFKPKVAATSTTNGEPKPLTGKALQTANTEKARQADELNKKREADAKATAAKAKPQLGKK